MLAGKAEEESRFSIAGTIAVVASWLLGIILASGYTTDGEQPGWRLLFLLPAIGVSFYFGFRHQKKVKAHTVALGKKRPSG
jgi:hypothetical protein